MAIGKASIAAPAIPAAAARGGALFLLLLLAFGLGLDSGRLLDIDPPLFHPAFAGQAAQDELLSTEVFVRPHEDFDAKALFDVPQVAPLFIQDIERQFDRCMDLQLS